MAIVRFFFRIFQVFNGLGGSGGRSLHWHRGWGGHGGWVEVAWWGFGGGDMTTWPGPVMAGMGGVGSRCGDFALHVVRACAAGPPSSGARIATGRGGGGPQVADRRAQAGNPAFIRTWAPFLLGNPARILGDDGQRHPEFGQLVGTRWSKSEDDGLFYAAWSAFAHWQATGDDVLLAGPGRRDHAPDRLALRSRHGPDGERHPG